MAPARVDSLQASFSTGESPMKTSFHAFAALLAGAAISGAAIAGDSPRSDSPHDTLRADTDGDGRVSRAEATAAGSQRSNEWFDKLDLDKDGYLTKEELQQAREPRRREMKERPREHFK